MAGEEPKGLVWGCTQPKQKTQRSPTTGSKFEGENAALVEVQLVLLRFGDMQDLHVAALHAHRQPLSCRAVAQGEDLGRETGSGSGPAGPGRPRGAPGCPSPYLGAEVVLLQLTPFPQVPAPHRVVQPPCPQLGAIVRDVDAAGTIRVALKLPGKEGDGEGEGTAVRTASACSAERGPGQHPAVRSTTSLLQGQGLSHGQGWTAGRGGDALEGTERSLA